MHDTKTTISINLQEKEDMNSVHLLGKRRMSNIHMNRIHTARDGSELRERTNAYQWAQNLVGISHCAVLNFAVLAGPSKVIPYIQGIYYYCYGYDQDYIKIDWDISCILNCDS
ncbi:hypothetical protein ACJX0J_012344 [Zea mays]